MAITICSNSDCRFRYLDTEKSCPECGELNRKVAKPVEAKPELPEESKPPAISADMESQPTAEVPKSSTRILRGGGESIATDKSPTNLVRGTTEFFGDGDKPEVVRKTSGSPLSRPPEAGSKPPPSHAPLPHAPPEEPPPLDRPPWEAAQGVPKKKGAGSEAVLPALQLDKGRGPFFWIACLVLLAGIGFAVCKFVLPSVLKWEGSFVRSTFPGGGYKIRIPSGYGKVEERTGHLFTLNGQIQTRDKVAASETGRWFVREGVVSPYELSAFPPQDILKSTGQSFANDFAGSDPQISETSLGACKAVRIRAAGKESGNAVHVAATAILLGDRLVLFGLVDRDAAALESDEGRKFLESFEPSP
ncbi:MAG: hypothetical protein AAB215_00045 [Planctomycetota bacterium]